MPGRIGRIHEIDLLKGLAVISMCFFHVFFIAHYLNIRRRNDMYSGVIGFSARFAHFLFIFLAGLNLYISCMKSRSIHEYHTKQCKRAILLFIGGIYMTVISYLAFPRQFVRFGILHFIAISSLILQFVAPSLEMTLALCFICRLLYVYRSQYPESFYKYPHLSTVLGVRCHYNTLDLFPLLKWIPLSALGILTGHLLYGSNIMHRNNGGILTREVPVLSWIGKNSLWIYLVHFPVIYVTLIMIRSSLKSGYGSTSHTSHTSPNNSIQSRRIVMLDQIPFQLGSPRF